MDGWFDGCMDFGKPKQSIFSMLFFNFPKLIFTKVQKAL
jgi:hypothetical protein